MLVYVCVCICAFVCAWVALPVYEHTNTTLHHCVLLSFFFLLIQLIGIALIICGIIVCVAYGTPGLHPIDCIVILFEAILFFTGALLAIAFSVFGFVAAHTRSRQFLLVVSCMHNEWVFCFCACKRSTLFSLSLCGVCVRVV